MQDWQLRPAHDLGLPLDQQLKSVRREGGLVNAITHLGWASFVAVYLKLAHRLSVEGREHLPLSGPFVLVANHASHLDSLVLASAVSWRLQNRVFPVAQQGPQCIETIGAGEPASQSDNRDGLIPLFSRGLDRVAICSRSARIRRRRTRG